MAEAGVLRERCSQQGRALSQQVDKENQWKVSAVVCGVQCCGVPCCGVLCQCCASGVLCCAVVYCAMHCSLLLWLLCACQSASQPA